MKKIFALLLLSIMPICLSAAENLHTKYDTQRIILSGVPFELKLNLIQPDNQLFAGDTVMAVNGLWQEQAEITGQVRQIEFRSGEALISKGVFPESGLNQINIGDTIIKIRVIPGWLSILPPVVAILLALLLRQVLVALFFGIWIGATLIYDYNPFTGLLFSFTEFIGLAPADPDKMSIIVFSLTLGGMVGVISKMGGMQGIVEKLSQYASDSRRGQLVTWMMGVLIFFDDYANTLIVGSTMRPLTDRLRISREKLSYLVDSTAAPVANIAIISTWIGFEIGLIGASFQMLGIEENAYITFFKTIPYNFYPLFTLAAGLLIALSGRDFGPMLKAERRARTTGEVLRADATPIASFDSSEIVAGDDIPKRWYNGLLPIIVVILTTLTGLWYTGISAVRAEGIDIDSMGFIRYVSTVIGASNSYSVLMWAAFLGSITAIILALGQRLLTLEHAIHAWVGGIKAMMLAALILTMAWAIGNICAEIKTADFVVQSSRGLLSAEFLPALTFIIASLISFATGTSWGVMAILMPIVIPMAHLLPQSDPTFSLLHQQHILLSTIAAVLAGATFGDHCSPISDTTIMSSMASGADHIDHVRTQIPYALFAGIVSIVIGYIPVGFGLTNWIALPFGFIVVFLVIRFLGRTSDQEQNSSRRI